MITYKGYIGEYQFEDGIFWGKVVNIDPQSIILFEAKQEKDLEKEFKISVDFYLDNCKKRGETPQPPVNDNIFAWSFPEKLTQKIKEESVKHHIPPQQLVQEIIEREFVGR